MIKYYLKSDNIDYVSLNLTILIIRIMAYIYMQNICEEFLLCIIDLTGDVRQVFRMVPVMM